MVHQLTMMKLIYHVQLVMAQGLQRVYHRRHAAATKKNKNLCTTAFLYDIIIYMKGE